jgi:hypothetical protein
VSEELPATPAQGQQWMMLEWNWMWCSPSQDANTGSIPEQMV